MNKEVDGFIRSKEFLLLGTLGGVVRSPENYDSFGKTLLDSHGHGVAKIEIPDVVAESDDAGGRLQYRFRKSGLVFENLDFNPIPKFFGHVTADRSNSEGKSIAGHGLVIVGQIAK